MKDRLNKETEVGISSIKDMCTSRMQIQTYPHTHTDMRMGRKAAIGKQNKKETHLERKR